MLFELPNNTECTLNKFVGRTQKSGKDDVPAVSFRLRLASVSNTMLDMFSKTMRLTVYEPVPGQEQLPGVELTTPILRSKDLKHWAPEDVRCEGWNIIVARGIDDDSALQMGKAKLDDFRFDFFEGGHMDVDFRVSTADLDEEGAGMLWGRQERKVFVGVIAPEVPPEPIDGTVSAFEKDHPDATDMFAAQHGEPNNGQPQGDGDDEGLDPDAGGDLPPDLEARVQGAIQKGSTTRSPAQSRTARGREATAKALAKGAQ
jgi:hypothetical protein